MNVKALIALLFLTFTPMGGVRADQFITGQAADVVLGQDDFGSPLGGPTHHFGFTIGVSMDPTTGKVFVCDSLNNRILRYSSAAAAQSGSFPEAVFGQPNFTSVSEDQGGAASNQGMDRPAGCHVDAQGRLWVADTENNQILGFDDAANALSNARANYRIGQLHEGGSAPGSTASTLNYPTGVWVDAADRLWVADFANHRVVCYFDVSSKMPGSNADLVLGQPVFGPGMASDGAEGMNNPAGVCVDAAGRLWVADYTNHRVLRFDDAANLMNGSDATAVLGQSSFGSSSSATTATGMWQPYGVLAMPDGALLVGDYNNNRVLGFRRAAAKSNGAAADFVLGQSSFTTRSAGSGAGALAGPSQLGLGPRGSIYVADFANSRVVRYSPVRSPVVTITTRPTSTQAATAIIRGRATGQVSGVKGRVGKSGAFRSASGTTAWSFRASLKPGKNLVTIIAEGPGGTSVARTVTITRK